MIDRSKLGSVLALALAGAVMTVGASTAGPAPATPKARPAAAAAKGNCCRSEGAVHDPAKCGAGEKACAHHAAAQAAPKAGAAARCPYAKAQAGQGYSCPMHPEVMSREKSRCRKCGMFLEKKG